MWIATIIIAVLPSIFVLLSLRRRNLDAVAKVLWVIVDSEVEPSRFRVAHHRRA